MKKPLKKFICLSTLLMSIFCLFPSIGYPASQITKNQIPASQITENRTEKKSSIQQIGPDEYRVGGLTLNKSRKEIYIPGSVNMRSGLVEYLACQAVIGKLHESVLQLEAKPSDVQIALLLLGFKSKNNLGFQGDSTIPEGDHLEIWVEWESQGNRESQGKGELQQKGESQKKVKEKVRAEELIFDKTKGKAMDRTLWAYTGSQVIDGKFMADVDGSIIATFRDPLAIINNPLPNGADDTISICNEKLLPPQGTKVLLTIKGTDKGTEKDNQEEPLSGKLLRADKS